MLAKILQEKRRKDYLVLFVFITFTIGLIVCVECLNAVREDYPRDIDDKLRSFHGLGHRLHQINYFRPLGWFIMATIVYFSYSAYTEVNDSYEVQCLEEALVGTSYQNPRLLNPVEKTFHQRLEEAGLTEEAIRNHPKLSFFYDPVTYSITEDPAITNTGELVDEKTAKLLITSGNRLFSENPISRYHGSPPLRKLLNLLVTEAIEETKSELKLV